MKTKLFFILITLSQSLLSQSIKDTFLIVIPNNYKIEKNTADIFNKKIKPQINDTLNSSCHLFYYTKRVHNDKFTDEYFGLILMDSQTKPMSYSRKNVKMIKARYLKDYYSILSSYDYFSVRESKSCFVNDFIKKKLLLYVVKEDDYLNDESKYINLYSCEYSTAIILE
ncbi:hypothetical protein [Plebeiibacterium sediminum]|uniref:Uncharacterized protein n=1 Tax=Plebeiibacterium sediminum TaxID=2992112 RepID=A0AAE3M511_9BACT|nr:hypothetical protein [Plebeiobacterium sediminum]MCW3786957.1 hypothetical protein [Plebeiobacterium sediminum]